MKRTSIIQAFAGTVVLVSVTLGWTIHSGWFFLTAFVGANLLQSAFTGFCPLGILLTKCKVGRE